MKLLDSFGRSHTSLRLSVTDRCNIRCFYCMPSEQIEFLPRPEVLSFEELTRATRIFCQLGITKLRLTGGEPLVRRDLPELVRQLSEIPEIQEIAMTTNAILLERFAAELRAAGLHRINISLDTLDTQQFKEITRRDNLEDVMRGIQAAQEAGFEEIRLNAVAVKGLIESQIIPLTRFCLEHALKLRFIEFMPLNSSGRWSDEDVLTGAKIRNMIEQEMGELMPVQRLDPAQPASDFRLAEHDGSIGFINSVSEPFCQACNRLRLTADGKIRNCLFSEEEWDLRSLLRTEATDQQIQQAMLECVKNKKAAHGIGSADFQKPQRAMYQIGG
ncbi:MAG: GTP 3',8-cyclase MoaA [Pirellulaceae bacterium]|nr:GTP 3',8-cyclase MoaA [Pirellulaceae bacterium]